MAEQKQNKQEMVYTAGGQEIKLSPSIVQQFIIKGNAKITAEEAVNFMQLCKYSELNPFLNEAYLIKYGSTPAQMVVSKEAFMKRANRQPDYNGFKAGVIVEKDGELIYRTGQFSTKQENLLGGWAKVYRKGIDNPFEVEMSLSEYNTGKSMWAKMPANMIRKVALVNALREAFPEALGALYSEEEPNVSELKESAKEVKEEAKDEVTNSILNDFKQQSEEEPEPEIIEAEFEEVPDPIETESGEMNAEQQSFFEGRTINPVD